MQKPARKQGRNIQRMEMFDDHGFPKFETNDFPLAYLITFRTYSTWHHGDDRFAVGRNGMNTYHGPRFQPSVPFVDKMKDGQKGVSVILTERQREIVGATLTEVCAHRGYVLQVQNIRTNHAHSVVSASVKPEKNRQRFQSLCDEKTSRSRRIQRARPYLVARS